MDNFCSCLTLEIPFLCCEDLVLWLEDSSSSPSLSLSAPPFFFFFPRLTAGAADGFLNSDAAEAAFEDLEDWPLLDLELEAWLDFETDDWLCDRWMFST